MRLGILVGIVCVLMLEGTALAGQSRAGVAAVDATWHVGASGGQYADDTGPVGGGAFVDPGDLRTEHGETNAEAIR